MIEQQQGLIESVREKFMHVEECPFEGKRIFFENAGGSLRLKSVVETSALFASYPDPVSVITNLVILPVSVVALINA